MAEKVAKRKLVRGRDGTLQVVFVDLKTGKVVTDLKGYKILQHNERGEQETVDAETGEVTKDKTDKLKNEKEDEEEERRTGADKGSTLSERQMPDGFNQSMKPENRKPVERTSQTRQVIDGKAPVSPVSTRQVNNQPLSPITSGGVPGVDLEARPRTLSPVGYEMGPNRPNVPSSGIVDKVQDVVSDVLGPNYRVTLTSGEEDEGEQYGSNRHQTGQAGDFKITDERGQVPSTQQMQDVAQGMAARYGANIGFGPEYMGNATMHIDTVPQEEFTAGQDAQWGSLGNKWTDALTQAREEGLMPGSYYDKFSQNAPTNLMTREQALEAPNGASATVAFDRFNEDERDLMARTLAGEIDTRYTDLLSPEGFKEAMGILSTMENRAVKYGNVTNAITADKQYSTWNNQAAADVANTNYEGNKALYDSLVNDYMSNPENNLGYTSYYNPSIANPSWGAQMANAEDIGPHRFGALSEYNAGAYSPTNPMGRSLDTLTDNVNGTGGIMAEAGGNVNLGGISGFDNSWGGMTSSENANRLGTIGGSDNGGFGQQSNGLGGQSFGGWGGMTSGENSIGGSRAGGNLGGTTSSVGSGFGSGTSGIGGGSYGGSGRSYDSSGSTSGGTTGGSTVGSSFGSGTSGTGGGSYGGSGRSYDSSGSTASSDGMGGRSDGWM